MLRATLTFRNVLALTALLLVCSRAELARANDNKVSQPEEEDYSGTPFTEYGEFNEDSDEEADTLFLQHGRFFGVSLGLGFQQADQNRGLLWQGGFPVVDAKLHYWFDFHFALDLGFYNAVHFFEAPAHGGHYDVNLFDIGLDGKYYFDTQNLSAPFSFANPYLLVGVGAYSKTETNVASGIAPSTLSAVDVSAGAGLEFALINKKLYFSVEGKIHLVNFADNYSNEFSPQVPNLVGNFYTLVGSFLFTW